MSKSYFRCQVMYTEQENFDRLLQKLGSKVQLTEVTFEDGSIEGVGIVMQYFITELKEMAFVLLPEAKNE